MGDFPPEIVFQIQKSIMEISETLTFIRDHSERIAKALEHRENKTEKRRIREE